MCVHYSQEEPAKVEALARDVAEVDELPLWTVTAHAWPKTPMPVVYAAGGRRTLTAMRWGIWPFYESRLPAKPTVNARDDKLLTGRLWPKPVASRRCLVPADAFYEYAGPDGGKWEVRFTLPERQAFFFAGIWSPDPAAGGRGFAIITTSAHPVVAPLPHDRTPVLLDRARALAWIGDSPLPAETVSELCRPFAGQLVRYDLAPKRAISATDVAQGQVELF